MTRTVIDLREHGRKLIRAVVREYLLTRWELMMLRQTGDIPRERFTIRQRALNGACAVPELLMCGGETPSPIIGAPPKRQLGFFMGQLGHDIPGRAPPFRVHIGANLDVAVPQA